ncbi:aromatic ring-hydroxylating dioxygenase subunit alpha [Telmatospirillum siberiense]|uniref:Ring-hydroxylating oxygenase subunit alpha n=1 Tax=Telmatospirillum siberiense TaxID=382514 RepID=A0A2N3PPT8_9PROT|nr:aromatic ring-hydroxylating dioxygenase subunit alpha [Telmatospirillum siberiense]PKU22407.1 ring-hydroxylating oxygenase subunit alpha [Telmatospirillum siberiense]
MMTTQQNTLVTRTGADTPAGKMMRMYWQPAALAEELADRPIKGLRLLGQDLVLFRDAAGKLALLDRHCRHRGADLAFGRLEDGGLRCLFHGWLFDGEGRCLERPAEPPGDRLCGKAIQKSYPVIELGGIIFAYLGEGEPPAFPAFDCFIAPDSHTFAFKGLFECNWLQALEVGIDPAHASYLHRFFQDEDPTLSYGRQFRGTSAGTNIPMTKILREFERPTIEVEATDYGLRIAALREIDDRRSHVRVTNLVFPQAFVIPMSAEMTITQWHVPVDDHSCYWYAIFTSFGEAVDREAMRRQRLELYTLPDYRSRRGKSNDYGYDADEQRDQTYTGMGFDINVHDQWAVESQGVIQDRTRELLGRSDKAIVAYRRLLLAEIQRAAEGQRPLMALSPEASLEMRGPATVDGIGETLHWRDYWQSVDRERRAQAAWGGSVHAR